METPKYWQEEPGKIIDTGKNVLESVKPLTGHLKQKARVIPWPFFCP